MEGGRTVQEFQKCDQFAKEVEETGFKVEKESERKLGPLPWVNPCLGLLAIYRVHHGAACTRVDRNGPVVLVVVAVHGDVC